MKKKTTRWNNIYTSNLNVYVEEKEKINFETIMDYLSSSAMFLFIFLTMILIFTSIWFIIGGTVFKVLLPLIYFVSISGYILFASKRSFKKELIPIAIGTIVFAIATIISGHIFDSTADGTTYHKLAVGAMKNGWNPVWQDVSKFTQEDGNPFEIYEDNVNTKWVNTYAKGSEIYGAVVYSFTNNIDTGKSFNMIFVYIAFFVLYNILKQLKLNTWKSIMISGILSFNPIILTQLTNYYLDGVLSICLFIIILTIMNRKILDDEINYLNLGMAIIWACSVKFTGIAFAGIFCIAFYLLNNYLVIKEEKKFFNKFLIKETIFYVGVVIISVCIIGSSSYLKNFITHGHPFYPLYGKGHVENMVLAEMPKSMQEDNNFVIFTKGIFSKSENSSPRYSSLNNEPDWKIPFTISKEELTNFTAPDLRIGGFGYFFGGVFILALIGTGIYLYRYYKEKDYESLAKHILVLSITFVLVFVLDGSYWARYIPYVFLVPIYVLINLDDKKKLEKYGVIVMIFFLTLNSVLILGVQGYHTIVTNRYIQGNLDNFVIYANKRSTVKIKLAHHGSQGVQYNLDDLGIENYILVENDEELRGNRDVYQFKY